MALPMAAVIRRRFKNSKFFVSYRGGLLPLELEAGGEAVVGWYRNPPPWDRQYVVFTTTAIHYRDEGAWVRVAWDDISEQEYGAHTKAADGVRFYEGEKKHFVRIGGRHGETEKFHDSFSLLQIVHAVVSARKRRERRESGV